MNYLNNLSILKGRVGKIIAQGKSKGGDAFIKLSVATNDSSYKDKQGEWNDNTSWHTVVGWGPVAERLSDLEKGEKIVSHGQYVNDDYKDDEGNDVYQMVHRMHRFDRFSN